MSCGEAVPVVSVVSAPVNDVDLQNQRIQDIASEVLRLRLVHSQYKQLEGQLKTAVDKLQQTSDKVFQFSQYLEQGLRPGGSIGTLGGSFSGVEVENLLGLMECLCVVCNAPVVSKKQEDLLAATKWLLQDADALMRRLSELPAAPSMQSRRLAPYLLSCDSSWRGQLNEAGQCYEALRSWLSCYYQFSLVSSQMEANAAQLQRQEQLLSELSKDDGGLDVAKFGDHGDGLTYNGRYNQQGEPGSLSAPTKPFAFRPCSLKRSSSVQSTSSAGSRRSQSPADRVARMANGIKVGGAVSVARRASREIREASIKSPLGRLSDRSRAVGQPPATASQAISSRTKPSALTEKRQVSSLSGGNEPSPRVTRLSSQLAMSTVSGMARVSRSGSAAAPPGPPMGSPRRQPYSARASYTEAKTTTMQSVPTRRHIVPPRVRRPSETSGGPVVTATSSRLTPASVVKAQEKTLESEAKNESAPLSPRNGHGQQTAFVRSRSLQSITEPEVGATPSRVTRPTEASARRSQITPIGGRLSSSASQPSRPHVVTSVWMSSRLSGAGTTPTTQGVRLHARTTKSTMPSKVESTGPVVRDVTPSAWALATSRSSPSLETRMVLGRQVRETAMATPRPLFSARTMR